MRQLQNFKGMFCKRIVLNSEPSAHQLALEDLRADLNNGDPVVSLSPKYYGEATPTQYATAEDVHILHYTTFNELDRKIYELGRVANTNPKMERMSTGENYKDITSVANRQKSVLEQLQRFAKNIKLLFNIELNFAVSGIPEKQRLETENEKAPDPNTEQTTGMQQMGR